VPDTTRIKAATLAALAAVLCAACGSTSTVSAGPIAPVNVDCGLQAPGPNSADGVFGEIDGFTVSEICPADVDPTFASHEFDSLAAGLVSQNGNPILRVLAGQLKSGSGHDFILTYLAKLADQAGPGVGVPSETEEFGAHAARHFNIPLVTDGYLYADGPTVVVAYVATGAPPATVEDALAKILDNLG
jgi:hypothetical protein